MEKYIGKIAVVTGASYGSGEAIAKALLKNGINVVGIARGIDKLEKIAEEVSNSPEYKGKLYPVKCDLTKEEEIVSSFKWIFDNVGPVHILVNNAGICHFNYLIDATSEQINAAFDINVKAGLICSQIVTKNMAENKTEGHILNINGLLGHVVPNVEPNIYALYGSAKHADRLISEGLRREMIEKNLRIKVTNFSPGYVRTPTAMSGAHFLPPEYGDTILEPEEVADALMSVIDTPPHVVISQYILLPLHLKF